jgi:hypothetical protein
MKEGEVEAMRHGWEKNMDPDDRPYWIHKASNEKCWRMPRVFERKDQDIVLEGADAEVPPAVPKPEERGGVGVEEQEEIEEVSDQEWVKVGVPVEPAIDDSEELDETVVVYRSEGDSYEALVGKNGRRTKSLDKNR